MPKTSTLKKSHAYSVSQWLLTLYRPLGQGPGCGSLSFRRFLRGAQTEALACRHRSLLWRRGVAFEWVTVCAAWAMATSYLSIDSSRSSDRSGSRVRDAVWGGRSGASRNLANDVRASDVGSSARVSRASAVIASRLVLSASRSKAHRGGRCLHGGDPRRLGARSAAWRAFATLNLLGDPGHGLSAELLALGVLVNSLGALAGLKARVVHRAVAPHGPQHTGKLRARATAAIFLP